MRISKLEFALFESRRTRFRKFKIREKFEFAILGFLSVRPNTRTFPRHKRRQDLIALSVLRAQHTSKASCL